MSDSPDPPTRDKLHIGDAVWVIEKEKYGTNDYTQGFVKKILTSKNNHSRGIKVMLDDGTIGRVQWFVAD